jgi:hypothetical protein
MLAVQGVTVTEAVCGQHLENAPKDGYMRLGIAGLDDQETS